MVQKWGSVTSGRKKEPKPKLFGPDIFQWGRGLPRERVGAKKFDTSLETREIKLFGRDIPGFCRDIPEVPEKFEKKKFVLIFRSLPYATIFGYAIFSLKMSLQKHKGILSPTALMSWHTGRPNGITDREKLFSHYLCIS